MIRSIYRLLLACALAPLIQCSDPVMSGAGGSSQTVNAQVIFNDTIVSVIIDDTVARALTLHAYSADYMPYEKIGYADSTQNSSSTVLHWHAPGQSVFCFLIIARPCGSACFLRDIALIRGAIDTIGCTLGPCRDVSGIILPGASIKAAPDERYALSIFGSPFYSVSDSARGFIIKNIPDGDYTLSVRSMTKRVMISTIDYSIAIDSCYENNQLMMVLP